MIRRLTIVAGGNPDLADLIRTLAERVSEHRLREIRLFGEDAERLHIAVEAFSSGPRRTLPSELLLSATDDISRALRGADAVLYSGNPGGELGRRIDERLPLEFGIPGNDAVGPGGFLSALRCVPDALAIAEAVQREAPNALLLNRAEPVSIVTQALADVGFEHVIGLCEQPSRDMDALGRALGLERGPRAFRAIGLHEAAWYTEIDLGHEPLRRPPSEMAAPSDLDEEERTRFQVAHRLAMEHHGAWPSSNLTYYERPDLFVALRNARGQESSTPAPPRQQRSCEGDLLVKVIASLNGASPRRLVLNLPNRTATPQLDFETVIQSSFEVSGAGVVRTPAPEIPPGEEPRLRLLELYQEKAAHAARRASEEAWVDALLANPLVTDPEVAKALVGDAKGAYGQAAPMLGGDGAPSVEVRTL